MGRNPLGLSDYPRNNTTFVIVIDVDNVRAREAYQKGMDDLDAAMPEIQSYAIKRDNKRREHVQTKIDVERQVLEHWQALKTAMDKYEVEYKEWMQKGHDSFWGTNKTPPPVKPPAVPPMPGSDRWYARDIPRMPREHETAVWQYNQVRVALKHKLDLATAAIGPFRMTEHDVRSMIAWEDGSEVASMLKRAKALDEQGNSDVPFGYEF